jgi:tRNA dimethylallyltransferase
MSNPPPTLFVLTGPTAVGKTELALRWAEEHDAEIVSCDSLLFYRGMNLGTAKPTRAELGRVPHHLIDICDVNEPMNVTSYVALARRAVDEIHRRGRGVLVTGGSGFYLKAFFAPVTDNIDVPDDLRRALETQLEREGVQPLIEELRVLNRGDLAGLDTANPRRVVRALERCRATGRTVRELREEFAARPSAFADCAVMCVRLDRPRHELAVRIEARVEQMLATGLIAEVEELLARGLKTNPSAARAIGYRETIAMLEGQLARADIAAAIAQNTRALVRKQLTWFRTQLPQHRVVDAATADVDTLFAP